jgi:uncharacterized protein (DUF1697 family)
LATHAALLRAVNLAGRNKVGMADVRALATSVGLADPRTLLQSGNVVFTAGSVPDARLEAALEEAARERLGLETEFFVRKAAEWKALLSDNPFTEEAARDPGHVLVVFLKDAPTAAAVRALEEAIRGRESVRAKGRQLYAVYPDGVGRSKLTMALIEKKLGTRGTGRNWNTVMKLGRMLGEDGRKAS